MNRSIPDLSDLANYQVRPALTEAHLLTEKHACDPVYVVTLSEDLCRAERAIEIMESSLTGMPSTLPQAGIAPATPGTEWIHSKCAELHARLHRLEKEFPERLRRNPAGERRRTRERAATTRAVPRTTESDAAGGRRRRRTSSSL